MSQMHELCLSDYRFAVLDTAFLVHRGIKQKTSQTPVGADEGWREKFFRGNKRVYKDIMRELKEKYPNKSKCKAHFRY